MRASPGQTLPPLQRSFERIMAPKYRANGNGGKGGGQLQFHATKVNEKGNACLIKEVHCNPCVPVVSHRTKTPP